MDWSNTRITADQNFTAEKLLKRVAGVVLLHVGCGLGRVPWGIQGVGVWRAAVAFNGNQVPVHQSCPPRVPFWAVRVQSLKAPWWRVEGEGTTVIFADDVVLLASSGHSAWTGSVRSWTKKHLTCLQIIYFHHFLFCLLLRCSSSCSFGIIKAFFHFQSSFSLSWNIFEPWLSTKITDDSLVFLISSN